MKNRRRLLGVIFLMVTIFSVIVLPEAKSSIFLVCVSRLDKYRL